MVRTDGILAIGGTVTAAVTVDPPTPQPSGGTTGFHLVAAASTNAHVIKAAPGQVYGVEVFNAAQYPVYVKFFNKAVAPNPAVDPVVKTVAVQAGLVTPVAIAFGLPFSVGIAIAIVKGVADADVTPVAAADCVLDVDYA